jgi:hypothetical protein
VEQKAEEVTEKNADKAEESVTRREVTEEEADMEEEASREETTGKARQTASQKLVSTSQYDFVPGDKILYFEDFSQDAIGDFPALWTTDGSGEVKTVNIAPGKWFHLNGDNACYCYTRQIDFPDNFIVEFDIIPDEEFGHGIQFTLYQDEEENRRR